MTDNENYDDGTFVQITCAECGEPLTVTAHTARVDDNNTYHAECLDGGADDPDGFDDADDETET